MKLSIKTKIDANRFDDLEPGSVFRCLESSEIFLKLQVKNPTDDINAVDLEDGQTCWVGGEDHILKIHGSFVEDEA